MTEVTCPSKLKVSVRGLKGKEAGLFSDKAAIRSGAIFDKLLMSCVTVVDPGIYKLGEDGKLSWDDVLVGDRFVALLQIRAATYGQEFEFATKCADCGHKFTWSVRLDQLPIKWLADEDVQTLKDGALLTATAPDGKAVKYRLATGKDEKAVARLVKTEDKAVLSMLARRISSIEGVENVMDYLGELSLGDVLKLAKKLDSRDCGVETAIDIECEDCGTVTETRLPLERGFLLPG